jgi:preprotein translocase subunit SecE
MNLTQKVNLFFKEVWVEMKRVSWLSRKEILKYTLIVLAATIAFAAFLGALDYIFSAIIRRLLINY